MNSEDSDATVAEEPLSGCCSDTEPEGGKSPSILSLAPKLPNREPEEIVPSSSGEASGVDDNLEQMSDEFPPLSPPKSAGKSAGNSDSIPDRGKSARNDSMPDRGSQSGPRPAHIQVVENRVTKAPQPPTVLNTCNKNPGTESGSSKEISVHSSPADNHHQTPTLEEVTAKQSTLLCDLQSADDPGTVAASTAVDSLRERAADLDRQLKATSLANQNARKTLAAAHASLSRGHSQQEIAEESQSLHRQLLSLAAKQKQLLQCCVKQKEIASKLSTLCEKQREKNSQHLTNPSPVKSTTRVGTQGSCVPTNVSVALPNLTQHLKPPAAKTIVGPTVASTINQTQHYNLTEAQMYPRSYPPQPQSQGIIAMQPKALDRCQQPQSTVTVVPTHQLQPQHGVVQSSVLSTAQCGERQQILKHDTASNVGPGDPLVQGKRSSDLAHPVPLDILVKHNFMQPGTDCISCKLIGCEFKASLHEDGSLRGASGAKFQQPQQWVNSCWATLGHQKKIKKTQAYKMVLYKEVPLLHYCEKYSLKQVSSYLSQQQKNTENPPQDHPTNSNTGASSCEPMDVQTVPANLPHKVTHTTHTSSHKKDHIMTAQKHFDITELLTNGRVFLVQSTPGSSVELPPGFWEMEEIHLSSNLRQQFEQDLNW